jgi:predicted enzyme related to lactoylglutathione lyase
MSHTQSRSERGESTAALSMVNIDSADPARLARFYAAALGWEVTYSDDSYGMVEGNGVKIGFGKIEGFRPAQWPDEAGVKRFHLDLQVDDLDEAAERLCAIGASQPDFQPGVGRWRVLLDPDGQPFCLSPRPAATP